MKKVMKSILTPLLVACFMTMPVVPAMAAEPIKTIDYVAFGDSVAAGVRGGVWNPLPEEGSDYGYTDVIANKLKDAGVLGSFNEDFCKSGMTAQRLALASEALNSAPIEINPAYNLVKNAEIVTLDIGANDLLGEFYKYVLPLIANPNSIWYTNPDVVEANVASILEQIMGGLYYGSTGSDVEVNIVTILRNILKANPNVKIYVMGYYNPLPELSVAKNMELQVNAAMEYFNTFIKNAINQVAKNNSPSIYYVDTMAAMAKNSDKNLVPTDIHPTEAGYRVIAKEFWSQIKLNLRKAE